MDLEIKYFDPSTMKPTAVILVIGKRGSGKSTVAEDIMSYQTNRFKEGMCISPTDSLTGFWAKHIPPLFIHGDYDNKTVDNFLDHQERKWIEYKKQCKREGKDPEEGNIDPAFVIFDDCSYDRSFFRNNSIRRVLMNGRHYATYVMITTQYMLDVGPDLRGQIDYVVILKDNNRNSREKLFKYFAGMFPSFAAFEETIRCCTENREAMVIDNTASSYNITDCVFFYKATPGLQYKLGDKEFWRFGTAYYRSDGEEEEDDSDDDVDKKFYQAGLSKKDRERAREFKIKKLYPDGDDDDEFKRKASGHYASVYRDNTVPPKTSMLPPETGLQSREKQRARRKQIRDQTKSSDPWSVRAIKSRRKDAMKKIMPPKKKRDSKKSKKKSKNNKKKKGSKTETTKTTGGYEIQTIKGVLD